MQRATDPSCEMLHQSGLPQIGHGADRDTRRHCVGSDGGNCCAACVQRYDIAYFSLGVIGRTHRQLRVMLLKFLNLALILRSKVTWEEYPS